MDELEAPSYNRIILTGLVFSSRMYSHADGRRVFRFTLGTRRLRMDEYGQTFLGWDMHQCQISGDKQCAKAMEFIRKNAWLHLEGNMKYDEKFQNTPQYVRRATVKVEYWQPIKAGEGGAPKVEEFDSASTPATEQIKKAQAEWDAMLQNKATGTDERDTRS